MKVFALIMIDLDHHFETTTLAVQKAEGDLTHWIADSLYTAGRTKFPEVYRGSSDPGAVFTYLETGDDEPEDWGMDVELQIIDLEVPVD